MREREGRSEGVIIISKLIAWLPRSVSFENVNLWVKRRGNVKPRFACLICLLYVRVEKAAHAIGRNGQLALSIYTERAKRTQRPPHESALQQSAIVAESVMVRAADR